MCVFAITKAAVYLQEVVSYLAKGNYNHKVLTN